MICKKCNVFMVLDHASISCQGSSLTYVCPVCNYTTEHHIGGEVKESKGNVIVKRGETPKGKTWEEVTNGKEKVL